MRKVLALLGGCLAGFLVLSAACGGGSDNSSATPTAATTTLSASTATPTAADLANDMATLRSLMQNMITKAQAGDVEATHDEGGGDKAIREIFKALLLTKDATLAYELETLKLDYDDNPDLTVVARDAQKVLDLLGQVAAALNISS
jgi:hypothetical protein